MRHLSENDDGQRRETSVRSIWSYISALANPRRSVRGKMTCAILLTAVITVLATGISLLNYDLRVYRESWASDLATQAGILALSTAAALAFDDQAGAERNLTSLRARPAVLAAGLYDADGRLYAAYARPGESPPPRLWKATQVGAQIQGERVEVSQRVMQSGEVLGTIYLRADYDVSGRVVAYLSIFSIIMFMSMALALLLSAALSRMITRPLDSMAGVSMRIVRLRDYALRAHRTTEDEIGIVVDAFNAMLDEVQFRTRALEKSNIALMEEAKVREAAEAALARANARLESSMAAAEIGGLMLDLRTDEIAADRNLVALFGMAVEDDLRGPSHLLRRYVHADDLGVVNEAEASCRKAGILPSIEFRIVRTDGTIRWLTSRGTVHRDNQGVPVLLAALLIDITARKAAEAALVASEKLYRAIGESIHYGVWVCNALGQNVYASESFLRLLGMTQQQCGDFGWTHVLHPDDREATVSAWQECVTAGRSWYAEHRIMGADGNYHSILAQGVPIRNESREITGWAGINLDISRLKQTEEALRTADRRKDEFLATLAHELRNPLAPITHAVDLLRAANIDDSKRTWAHEIIGRQVKRMALLLDDLLDVSRATQGRLVLRKHVVSLSSLIESATEIAGPLINSKNHTFRVDLPAEPIELDVDPLRLSQALSNLLTNAAKYTDVGGHIALIVSRSPDAISFCVRDTGIGLRQDSLPRLFEMFSQVDSAIDRTEGGLGIGLALVKGLVFLHGGTVDAVSEGIGCGSQFTIRLPSSAVVRNRTSTDIDDRAHFPSYKASCKVLVTDDNRDAAETFALVLQFAGHDVRVAHSGRQAIEIGHRERPDVIILDIGMAEMTGYEVAEQIRKEPWGRNCLMIAVTGWGQEDDRARAKAAGFDHHLTKPVKFENIDQLIAEFLTGRRVSLAHASEEGKQIASST